MLPKPVIEFSKVNLPGTNILTRASLSQMWLYNFKMLTKKTNFTNKNEKNDVRVPCRIVPMHNDIHFTIRSE